MSAKSFMVPTQMGLSGSGSQVAGASSREVSFAANTNIDALVRQEQHLGLIRELVPPSEHIGLKYCPWKDVATDDYVFDFLKGSGAGMAPAVAQDAESVLFQDIDDITGQMRASIQDWRLKSRYTSSDVMTYRDLARVKEVLTGAGANLPLYVTSVTDGFPQKIARDTARRKLWLDNRIEWMILTSLSTGKLEYNDGHIRFAVDWKRPVNQQNMTPASGVYGGNTHDPINDLLKVKEFMFQEKFVKITRGICSSKVINSFYKSSKFIPRTGYLPSQGVTNSDLPYLTEGWGPMAALDLVQRETGITFEINDNVFAARDFVTGAVSNQRFIPENQLILLPDDASLDLQDDSEIGFAKMLTSPHPMGNFTPGFYSWEQEETDPWQHVIGSGVKAFPVFPHMDLSATVLFDLDSTTN